MNLENILPWARRNVKVDGYRRVMHHIFIYIALGIKNQENKELVTLWYSEPGRENLLSEFEALS